MKRYPGKTIRYVRRLGELITAEKHGLAFVPGWDKNIDYKRNPDAVASLRKLFETYVKQEVEDAEVETNRKND